jgi:hypothetical protein
VEAEGAEMKSSKNKILFHDVEMLTLRQFALRIPTMEVKDRIVWVRKWKPYLPVTPFMPGPTTDSVCTEVSHILQYLGATPLPVSFVSTEVEKQIDRVEITSQAPVHALYSSKTKYMERTGKNPTCMVRLKPRTWFFSRPDDFLTYYMVEPDGTLLGATIKHSDHVTKTHISGRETHV